MLLSWLFIIPLVYVSITDLKSRFIPDKVIYPLAVVALATAGIRDVGYVNSLAGGGVGLGTLLFMALLSRGNTGFGDVKLAICLGFILGVFPCLYALSVAFVSMGVYRHTKRLPRGSFIPLAPFFTIGFIAGVILL